MAWKTSQPNLKKLGIPTKIENTSRKLHHKVGVIDNRKTITGSFNGTLSANDENDENGMDVTNSDIAHLFTDAFEELWNGVLVD